MITLAQLMDLVCTSDALTIADIVENILHRDDEDDFYLGAESLWVKSGESWTREAARELGWGCRYLVMMEDAVEETEGSEWIKANADQRRDLREQKIMMATLVHVYLFLLYEEGHRPRWLVRDKAWGEDLEFKIDDSGEEVEIWIVKGRGRKVKVDIGERIELR